jgi:large conductance mechanosensitive channel
MKELLSEFKSFIAKGNVIQLAVGVIIGGAFGKIIDALVNSLLNPIIGAITRTESLATLTLNMGGFAKLGYGAFIAAVVNFLIVAAVIFMIIKLLSKAGIATEEKTKAPVTPEDILLLREIRDSLKKK